ncbi:MAG: serine protease, partial [Nakamurella sp.]
MNNPQHGEHQQGAPGGLVPVGVGARSGEPAADRAVDGSPSRPRLDPKPIWRPPVDPVQTGAFGRPGGVNGSFGPRGASPAMRLGAPPVPEYLEDAFGRPADAGDSLGRPPAGPPGPDDDDAPGNPWRDPASGASLGPPALTAAQPAATELRPADRFTLRQAL